MSRVLITGSSDGLGLGAARLLAHQHHDVVLHARNRARASDALAALPEAVDVLVGDFTTIAGMRQVVEAANALGRFDAVIHNAAVGSSESRPIMTSDGMSHVFAVNVLAPYLLTSEIEMPRRLVYLSSGMHRGGNARLDDLQWERRRWSGPQAYSDSKLFVAVLAAAVAAPIPRCPVQRRRSRLGGHQDGGSGRARRPRPGFGHPGVAGCFRRPRCPCVRRLLLSPAPERGARLHARRPVPRRAARGLRRDLWGRAARRGAGRLNGFAARATSQVRTTSIVDRVGSAAYATRTP